MFLLQFQNFPIVIFVIFLLFLPNVCGRMYVLRTCLYTNISPFSPHHSSSKWGMSMTVQPCVLTYMQFCFLISIAFNFLLFENVLSPYIPCVIPSLQHCIDALLQFLFSSSDFFFFGCNYCRYFHRMSTAPSIGKLIAPIMITMKIILCCLASSFSLSSSSSISKSYLYFILFNWL